LNGVRASFLDREAKHALIEEISEVASGLRPAEDVSAETSA
jgi:phenylpyruvate tautomerase PptA (4-oxalocrotonate tautomerase family)